MERNGCVYQRVDCKAGVKEVNESRYSIVDGTVHRAAWRLLDGSGARRSLVSFQGGVD